MKGHVGGGPGYRQPLGAGVSVKVKPFLGSHQSTTLMGSLLGRTEAHASVRLYMSQYISTVYVMCRNGSQRCRPAGSGFSPCRLVGHKLESLILAQNERWRHA